MKTSVTLDGDMCNPAGVLSGGARKQTASVLLQMARLKSFTEELNVKKGQLDNVELQLRNIQAVAERYVIYRKLLLTWLETWKKLLLG